MPRKNQGTEQPVDQGQSHGRSHNRHHSFAQKPSPPQRYRTRSNSPNLPDSSSSAAVVPFSPVLPVVLLIPQTIPIHDLAQVVELTNHDTGIPPRHTPPLRHTPPPRNRTIPSIGRPSPPRPIPRTLERTPEYGAEALPNLSIFNYNVSNAPVEQKQETTTDGCVACFKSMFDCMKKAKP